MSDDNDDQMIFGDLVGQKLSDICLTGEENHRKASARKLVPTGDRIQARCVIGAHATTWSTAVDTISRDRVFLILLKIRDKIFNNKFSVLLSV